MLKRKRARQKGKKRLSEIFKELQPGDSVVLVRDLSSKGMFPKHFHGKVARVVGKQGSAYIVKFLNGKVPKTLIVRPEHLKKLKTKKAENDKK